jgi:hypothetical protein
VDIKDVLIELKKEQLIVETIMEFGSILLILALLSLHLQKLVRPRLVLVLVMFLLLLLAVPSTRSVIVLIQMRVVGVLDNM